ncbi:bifunctional glycosyltransferase/CDP-glycerol:glycerophosphate glycerophosphotransferase [Wenjunlia tyrosinilytica]|uniref:Glycosyl transferase n=1 Tax=Wenjunlia tyrosinilytica TaxID=1544741 RepID=A0A917ZXD5_9ACTN|nr:bifunctional glycosyltransferase/CDP-glycerol:glycerophosphate glycerophosphotransferase [Wenjunlia tyrosinilytica]GGO97403.1 glycosyl transferase [Wenjunlia tyrosinilytica]
MPRLSIVVPVHNVRGYLSSCLDSILTQSFTDFEVIGVDDASPDGCGRILDEYAARDPRITAVHLPRNVGLGRARNAGAARATGDYLLFLDSDDSYSPGALRAVAERLAATGDPDILVFNHVRTSWRGSGGRSDTVDLLRSAGKDTFTVHERPEYLRLFLVAWNKAYRREFFTGHGLAFAPGLYEDAPVTYRAMLLARSIACLDRVCVEYRQRRQGAITSTPGRKHFDIFPQYDALFDFLDGRPDLDDLAPAVFTLAIGHFLSTVDNPQRVHPADRREFYRAASRFYRRRLPEGFRLPEGPSGERFALLARGAGPAYTAHRNAAARERLRSAAARGLGPHLRRLRRAADRYAYRRLLRLPLDENLAVFTAYWNQGVYCSPAALERAARELAPGLRCVWVVKPSAVESLPPGTDHVEPGTRRYWEVMARAAYFIGNTDFPHDIEKREGSVHVQTHHGTPLKTMGLDRLPRPAAATGVNFGRMLRLADRWDYSVVGNPHSAEVWERAYPAAYRTLAHGTPRNDVFFTATAADVARVRAGLGIAEDRTAVLYAPTRRDYRKGYLPRLDVERLARRLGPGYQLLVRLHHSYAEDPLLAHLAAEGLVLDVSAHPGVEELCLAADALVTDYSSIMFDYACLDRPIVVHADDWPVFTASRGVYFDLLSGAPGDTPGVVARTEDELVEAFVGGLWDSPEAARLRSAFRERFCVFEDGRAAERVIRSVVLGEPDEALPPFAPMAERTPAPGPRPRRTRLVTRKVTGMTAAPLMSGATSSGTASQDTQQ